MRYWLISRGLKGHIEVMWVKISTSKFIASLDEYRISLQNEDEYMELIIDLIASEKLEVGDLEQLLQSVILKTIEGNIMARNWIVKISDRLSDEVKSMIEPSLEVSKEDNSPNSKKQHISH